MANGKWVLCRHKERTTYELPGGHREENESISAAAVRELKEETGAIDFSLTPVCVYSVKGKTRAVTHSDGETFGMLYVSNVFTFGEIHSEIAEIILTDDLNIPWTYPSIQPKLIEEAKKRGYC